MLRSIPHKMCFFLRQEWLSATGPFSLGLRADIPTQGGHDSDNESIHVASILYTFVTFDEENDRPWPDGGTPHCQYETPADNAHTLTNYATCLRSIAHKPTPWNRTSSENPLETIPIHIAHVEDTFETDTKTALTT